METRNPPRWQQRLNNYSNALSQLKAAVALSHQRDLSDLEKQGLITEGEFWMEMIKSRNETFHTYNRKVADEISDKIKTIYCGLFEVFLYKMLSLVKSNGS